MMNRVLFFFLVLIVGCASPVTDSGTTAELDDALIASETYEGDMSTRRQDHSGGWSRVIHMVSEKNTAAQSLQRVFSKAEVYTVTFSLNFIDDVNQVIAPNRTVAPIFCEALIEFTVAGNTYSRLISVEDGMSISGVANSIRVRLTDVTKDLSTANIGGLRYSVSVQFAPGVRADSLVPPFLQTDNAALLIAGGGHLDIQIPTGGLKSLLALVASANGSVIPDQGAQVFQRSSFGTIVAYDPRSITWCPLSPGAISVRLQNFTAVNQLWSVFWGSDG